MKRRKEQIWQRVLHSNLNNTAIVAGLIVIMLPVCVLFSSFVFGFNIFQIDFILPVISIEIISAIFLYLSKDSISRVKRLTRPRFNWIYRCFWIFAFNAAMYGVSNTSDPALVFLLFAGATVAMAVFPLLGTAEFMCSLANEGLWIFFLNVYKESPLSTMLTYLLIVLASAIMSRIIYSKRIEVMKLRQRLNGISKDAMVDPLTGLLNRRGFDRQVESIWPFCVRNDYKVALMIIDVDNFKLYNDEFGHPEGDQCLKKVAESIRGTARRTTDIVSRIGGEEFLVFIQGSREDEMLEFADTIRKNVEKLAIPHSENAAHPYVTVSVGLEIAVPKGMNINMLYEGADRELYQAKESGRNAVSYSGSIRRRFSVLA